MEKSSTLKEVAKKLNVSVSTVSRAVNNKEYVKEATREKVLRALEEYNYVPNEIARSLKTQSTKTIGVVLPDICESFFGMIIKGIDKVVAKYGYTIIVADTNENRKNEEKYLSILYQKRIDALVLATVDLKGQKVVQYFDNSIPVVFIDNIPQLERSIDFVTIDNFEASKKAVHYLLKKGHKKIATIIGSIEETTGYQRMEGYKDVLEEAGIPVQEELIQYGNYKEDKGYQCMCALLDNKDKCDFTAVYVTSEMMTFGAIKAILNRGLRIPEDISFVGFDVHDKAGLVSPAITTIRQDEEQIGRRTGELLISKLKNKEGNDNTGSRILLEAYLVEGQSVKDLKE